jgi:alpha-beta hydrolase superfamily lysophospholipase
MPKFEGAAGTVYYRHWASLEPIAQIVFLHGYGEHSALYHRFGDFMNAQRIDVWAPDAIGHGLSDGIRGDADSIESLRQNAEKLGQIAQERHPELPMVLVGHSMGAMAAAALVSKQVSSFCGVILGGMPIEELTADQEALVAQGIMSLDPFYLDELENDPLKFDTWAAFTQLRKLFSSSVREALQAGLRNLKIPVLMVCGSEDLFCPPDVLRLWAARIPGARARVFPGAHHDLINDTTHSEVAGEIAATTISWSAKDCAK